MTHNGTAKPFLNDINFNEVQFICHLPEHGSFGFKTENEATEAVESELRLSNGEREAYVMTIEEFMESLEGNGLIVNEDGFLADAE